MLVIGIAGGSGSGKTTVVKAVMQQFTKGEVCLLSQDSYYRDNGHLSAEERARINFDHPSSIEFSLLCKHLDMLKAGEESASTDQALSAKAAQVLAVGEGSWRKKDGRYLVIDLRTVDRNENAAVLEAIRSDWEKAGVKTLAELHRKMNSGGLSQEEKKRWHAIREEITAGVMHARLEALFEVKPVQADPPAKARILASLTCDGCGEAVMESRMREHQDRRLCAPCLNALLTPHQKPSQK